MQILQNVSDEILSPEERARWQDEYDQMYDQTQKWMKKSKVKFSPEEMYYFTLMKIPKLWAAETLNWICRDYQEPMLQEMVDSKRVSLRLGRRLGKTDSMCVTIMYYATTQPNKAPNSVQYNILIVTPYEDQIQLIFTRLRQLIDMSQGQIAPSRDIENHIELPNGTIIHGMTAGSKSGSGAANTRGQRADLIVLDEADYLTENDITNIMNIRNEAPERIRMIVASTPSGRRDSYYKWCTGATLAYTVDEETTAATGRVTYHRKMKGFLTNSDGTDKLNPKGGKIRDGNGWTTIHAPSTVNPELLKINPDTGLTYIEELRLDLTELRFTQEVMAEFGESVSGVFLKKHIDLAIDLGKKLRVDYRTTDFERNGPRILGVDWDKSKADTNMVGMEWNYEHNKFIPFFRKVIPRGDFTYQNAVQAIKDADREFQFDFVMCDAGHGENQIEQLRQWYMKHPEMGSAKKIERVHLGEKITVYDPVTKRPEKKDIKPFMVNNAVWMFEREMVALNPSDRDTITQFEAYEVKSWGSSGRPTYTDENEHILDCIVFCLFGFIKHFDDILKVTKASAIFALKNAIDRRQRDSIKKRDITTPSPEQKQAERVARALGVRPNPNRESGYSPARRSFGMPSRRSF
ncbi:terminase large subunit domain-containing protein (plasmid) [Paenibacillus sp. EC2-1]|uniref:terminase large subunit domain-containing protein n=1 Tax=Paenibacillus sp. EC2-1 TaxID=3388665 RepID=UPI003BEF319A